VRQHLFNRDTDTAPNAIRANQIITNLAVTANLCRIAEWLKTDLKLTVLAFECVTSNRATFSDSFKKPG
jgi:hypothetical protein